MSVDVCKHTAGRFMDRPDADPDAPGLRIDDIRIMYHKLGILCRKPLHFHSERTFSDAHRLQGAVSYLMNILEKAPMEAEDYWKAEVSPIFDRALSSIFKEIENILQEEQSGSAKDLSFRGDGLKDPGPRLSL